MLGSSSTTSSFASVPGVLLYLVSPMCLNVSCEVGGAMASLLFASGHLGQSCGNRGQEKGAEQMCKN